MYIEVNSLFHDMIILASMQASTELPSQPLPGVVIIVSTASSHNEYLL